MKWWMRVTFLGPVSTEEIATESWTGKWIELYSKQALHSIEQLFYLKEEQLLKFNTVKKVTSDNAQHDYKKFVVV